MELPTKPKHVPEALLSDFDMYNVPGVEGDSQFAWKQTLGDQPFVYTLRNGGHWVATRGDDIAMMYIDSRQLSNASCTIPGRPAGSIMLLPDESDAPTMVSIARRSITILPPPRSSDASPKSAISPSS